MPTDYEEVYRDSKHALGEPTREFVEFFESLQGESLRVLDLGCGQGRDALFVARLGHRVVGVDQSATGIRDLMAEAAAEDLSVTVQVADIRAYEPDGLFDALLFDRTLHMLDSTDRRSVLARLINSLAPGGFVLIADQRTNIPALEAELGSSGRDWQVEFRDRGYLFVRFDH